MSNGSEHIPEATDYKTLIEVARARYKLACDEMDRLTAGNPGTNWRWSVPANPARDSDLILSASAEDVPRLADAVESLLGIEQRLTDHIVQLAAERDALQAKLDAMTVEWGATVIGKGPVDAESEEHARAIADGPIRQRLVSEWTVVEGEQPHA